MFAPVLVFFHSFLRLSNVIMMGPHLINRYSFLALEFAVQTIELSLKMVVSIWEYLFDLVMKRFGQQPSKTSGSILSIFTVPMHASGISALVSIIFKQLMRVPQGLEDFTKWCSMAPNAVIILAVAGLVIQDVARNQRRQSSLVKKMMYHLLRVMFAADIAVFLVLIVSTLIPLICIFTTLALAAYAVNYFRPNLRPKHVAPCMALIVAQ